MSAKQITFSFSGSPFTGLPIQLVEGTEGGSQYLPMVHGKGQDAFPMLTAQKLEANPISGTGTAEWDGVRMIVEKFTESGGPIGISTHKLLSTGVALFTANNNIEHRKDGQINVHTSRVAIPLKEYATLNGYKVVPQLHEGMTEEEAEEEKKRAKNALDNARKKIKKDIDTLTRITLEWTEKGKGAKGDFYKFHILGGGGIKNGMIYFEFIQTMAEYLMGLPLTQYPVALLRIDERSPNAYRIGLKMVLHYNMHNNQIRGTATRLKVKTLLDGTDLPNIEDIRAQKRSWENRIKEPLENNLESLTHEYGLLLDWRYSGPNGKELTDEEATFVRYEDWADTLVEFTLKNPVDHTPALEARAEKQEKIRRRASKKKASGTGAKTEKMRDR